MALSLPSVRLGVGEIAAEIAPAAGAMSLTAP
jgi:hypothetical protein